MKGLLCSDCHIEKTREFVLRREEGKRQEVEQKEKQKSICHICNSVIASDSDRKKPEWKWNMDMGTIFCSKCYEKMETDFTRKLNFCATCERKMGFIRYNPKPQWKLNGQLCRKCWDEQNLKSKKNEHK